MSQNVYSSIEKKARIKLPCASKWLIWLKFTVYFLVTCFIIVSYPSSELQQLRGIQIKINADELEFILIQLFFYFQIGFYSKSTLEVDRNKMDTKNIMNIALELAGFDDIPGDSEIFYHGENIKKILFGIDIWDEDLIKAKELGVDLVISHHPPNLTPGKRFAEVIDKQIELMVSIGVPFETAQKTIVPIKNEYKFNPLRTHEYIVSLAQKLHMPLMNIHQPCDEIGRRILQSVVDELGESRSIVELIDAYNEIIEIRESGNPVELVCGSSQNKIGKAIVIHGAGTNGGYPVANTLFDHGVNTVIYIHLLPHQKADRERLIRENKGNLIVTGHYPSDAIGINPLIRELEKRGLEVIRCNGV